MALSWTWFFILGAIIYGVFLGLGCGGLIVYDIWNVKNMRKIRQREAEKSMEFLRGEKGSVMTKDSLDDLSLGSNSWRDSKATTATIVSASSFDAREGSTPSLEDLSISSDEETGDKRRVSRFTLREMSLLSCIGEDERERGSKLESQVVSERGSEDGGHKNQASIQSHRIAADGDLATALQAQSKCPRGSGPRLTSKAKIERRRSSVYSQASWNF